MSYARFCLFKSGFLEVSRSLLKNYTITYISDHGEAVGENGWSFGHVDAPAPKQVYQIPLFFALSESVKDTLSREDLGSLSKNLNKRFESNGMIHTLLHLYGLGHPRWQRHKSLFSKDYKEWERFCDNLQ